MGRWVACLAVWSFSSEEIVAWPLQLEGLRDPSPASTRVE